MQYPSRSGVVCLLAAAYFTAANLAVAFTKLPYVDEGTFIGSAWNIVHTGYTGNPSTPPWGLGIPLIESQRYNFWVMPGYLYTLATWFRAAPETLFSARVLSVIFGLGSLVLFYDFVRRLSGSAALSAFAFCLLAVDFNMALRCSIARMDSMSLMLNIGAWSAYLALRGRHFTAAIFSATIIAAASLATHPNGIFAFAGIAILAASLDRQRIRARSLVPAAAGIAIPFVFVGLLVAKAPEVFREQAAAHSQGRFDGIVHPLSSLREEFLARYYWSFGGVGFGSPLDSRFPVERMALLLVLAAYTGACFCLLLPSIRKQPIAKIAGSIFAATAIYFTFFETGKLVVYNIHLLPWFCLFLAIATSEMFRRGQWRIPAAVVVAGVVLVNVASTVGYVHGDRYRHSYRPALALLQSEMGPQDLVLTHAYFGVDLGFNRVTEDFTLVDVVRRKPKFVTLDHWFRLDGATKTWPLGPDPVAAGIITQREKFEAADRLEHNYRLVLKNADYEIYQRMIPF